MLASLDDFGWAFSHTTPSLLSRRRACSCRRYRRRWYRRLELDDDGGLSYQQTLLKQIGVKRLVERCGRLGGQLGVHILQHEPLGADLYAALGSTQIQQRYPLVGPAHLGRQDTSIQVDHKALHHQAL